MKNFLGAKNKPPAFGKDKSEIPAPDPNRLPPVFSFEHMIDGSGYSVVCCNQEHQGALLRRFLMLSKVPWFEIMKSPRHGIGTEKIAKLNVPLPTGLPGDVNIIAMRYHGNNPIVGYRDGRVLHVLFVDHNFSVYNHG